ncbi:hypothetical protein ACFV3E_45460 [Streptomyces sp. NPDC059718]
MAPVTVDRCRARYAEGVAGLEEKKRGGQGAQVPPRTRARALVSVDADAR